MATFLFCKVPKEGHYCAKVKATLCSGKSTFVPREAQWCTSQTPPVNPKHRFLSFRETSRKQVICTPVTSDINFLESKSKEHPYTPFISLHLKVVLISCNREIINCCGTCKFISPRIDSCTSARNYGGREMIFHTIADGLVFIINTPLFYFRLHLGIVMGINRDGGKAER